jgi:hypothetical protein
MTLWFAQKLASLSFLKGSLFMTIAEKSSRAQEFQLRKSEVTVSNVDV